MSYCKCIKLLIMRFVLLMLSMIGRGKQVVLVIENLMKCKTWFSMCQMMNEKCMESCCLTLFVGWNQVFWFDLCCIHSWILPKRTQYNKGKRSSIERKKCMIYVINHVYFMFCVNSTCRNIVVCHMFVIRFESIWWIRLDIIQFKGQSYLVFVENNTSL